MIALIQRVTQARVRVDGAEVGAIDHGVLALLCAQRGDSEREADALLAKLLVVSGMTMTIAGSSSRPGPTARPASCSARSFEP
jgi:D-Tyr-tRNAtyr deacylase